MYSTVFLLLTAVICVTVASDKPISIKVTPQHVLAVREISKNCAEKTGVDPGILTKVIHWTFEEDEATKAYVYCLSVNAGYVDTDGNVDVSKMLKFEVIKGTQEEYANKLNECNKVKKENKIENVFVIGNCLNSFIEIVAIKPTT